MGEVPEIAPLPRAILCSLYHKISLLDWLTAVVCAFLYLYLISLLKFSLDLRVDLMSVTFIVGGLILLKGVTAKRVYKNWLLEVMESAIYFNLVAFHLSRGTT